jgi:TatD DNase family protein
MDIFDTHAHYDDSSYDEDRDEILSAMTKNNVKYIINQGINIETSKFAISLADKYSHIYAAVGIHPEDVDKAEDINEIKKLAMHKKVVAIGEIGLDYHYDNTNKPLQQKYFYEQLNIANELNLPVVVHDRDAHKDILDTLKSIKVKKAGVVHCFSGSVEMAKELLKLDYYLGFDGPITFKNARTALEVLEYIPLDKILIETDTPYLAPVPYRGKTNEPAFIVKIAQKLAEAKNLSLEEIANITKNNFFSLYQKATK